MDYFLECHYSPDYIDAIPDKKLAALLEDRILYAFGFSGAEHTKEEVHSFSQEAALRGPERNRRRVNPRERNVTHESDYPYPRLEMNIDQIRVAEGSMEIAVFLSSVAVQIPFVPVMGCNGYKFVRPCYAAR